MNNFNTNLYETKREIINYSNKITEGLKSQQLNLLWICYMVYRRIKV